LPRMKTLIAPQGNGGRIPAAGKLSQFCDIRAGLPQKRVGVSESHGIV
jgi:hypothetical protein